MSIQNRLLLFLLPPIIVCALLISVLLSYNWYREIHDSFTMRLNSALVSCSAMINPEQLLLNKKDLLQIEEKSFLSSAFQDIKKELKISDLYIIHLDKNNYSEFVPITTQLSIHEGFSSLLRSHNNEKLFLNKIFPPNSKDVAITPIYTSEKGTRIMTGYAPIYNKDNHLMAFLAADLHVNILIAKLKSGIFIISLYTVGTIFLILILLFIVANKIAKPVQRLNNSALAIAAGNYEEKVSVKGPTEIAELSHTLNTMSECLNEYINRLKENSLIKQKMYGEYECAMLLQDHMLQKIIDENKSDIIAAEAITFFSHNPQGFLLDIEDGIKEEFLKIRIMEAEEKGFEGMYDLLTHYKNCKKDSFQNPDINFPSMQILLHKKSHKISFYPNHLHIIPIGWSIKESQLIIPQKNELQLQEGDLFFLYNKGTINFLETELKMQSILAKVLKFFAEDGLYTCVEMLEKELAFISKKKEFLYDIHLLCFQILY